MGTIRLACGLAIAVAGMVSWLGVYQTGVAAPTEPTGTVTSKETFKYYDVRGKTLDDLRRDVFARGPFDAVKGQRFAGWTSWNIRWWLDYQTVNEGCAVGRAATETRVTYTLPRWTDAAKAPIELQESWARFSGALTEHEHGHGHLARELGARIKIAIEELQPQPTCEQLNRRAGDLAHHMIWNDKEQEAYDRRTGHGATQGAAFPRVLVRAQGTETSEANAGDAAQRETTQ